MPRQQPESPPHLEPRAEWERAFQAEVIRLKPHMAGAGKLLATATTMARVRHGIESDPVAVARQYHADQV